MLSSTTGWMDRSTKITASRCASSNIFLQFRGFVDCHDVLPYARTVLTLSTDLNKLADEIRLSAPNYFFNVPRCSNA